MPRPRKVADLCVSDHKFWLDRELNRHVRVKHGNSKVLDRGGLEPLSTAEISPGENLHRMGAQL